MMVKYPSEGLALSYNHNGTTIKLGISGEKAVQTVIAGVALICIIGILVEYNA